MKNEIRKILFGEGWYKIFQETGVLYAAEHATLLMIRL